MHSNRRWLVFLCAVGLCAAILLTRALLAWQGYAAMTSTTQTIQIRWSTESNWRGTLYPQAHFQYQVEGRVFEGISTLSSYSFRNSAATEDVFERLGSESRRVWYDPSKPSRASLSPSFPLKELACAFLAAAIFFYLFCLGLSVGSAIKS